MLGVPGGIEWLIILFIIFPALILPVVLFWLILGRAGLPEPLALIALFPGFGELALLFVLAFARWPAIDEDGEAGAAG